MRCMALAGELKRRGAAVSFLCRELPGHLCNYLESQGLTVIRLPPAETEQILQNSKQLWLGVHWEQDAEETEKVLREKHLDWLIVDSYALDAAWESRMRPHVGRIMVIDDLADRRHECDILLDQNYYISGETRYKNLVPEECRLFLGPHFALLRPEFLSARRTLRERDGTIDRILVFFGGADASGETEKTLAALSLLGEKRPQVDIVVGASNPRRAEIEQRCSTLSGVTFHCQISDMARLMAEADFAFGGGGTTTWERCFLGLPAATVILAQNQQEVIHAVASTGALRNLGWLDEVTSSQIAAELDWAISNPQAVHEIGRCALALMGTGEQQNNSLIAALCE